MYEVSNQFKEYCKRHIRAFKNATITYYDGDEQQTIESEEIIKFDISAEPYIDYQIIGQAVAKKIHISIRGSYDLANKEVNVTTTMIYDDNTEEVLNLGDYIIASDYDSSVKNQCSFTGYDYMIKMDDEYSDEGLTYPCTIQDVIENICEQKDIELATTDLPNGDLEVIGNNFQDGATYRDVIKQIAQVNGTFAYIDRENKLHIDTLMNHETIQGEGTSITLSGTTPYGNILDYMLKGNTTQSGTPTPSSPVLVNNVTGLQTITISSGADSKNYEINLGKNLYEGSQDFSGNWDNADKWTTADETYNGLVVKYRQGTWNGLVKEIEIEKGGTYTFSFYAKKDVNGTINAYTGGGVGAVPDNASFNATTEWQRFSFTFTSSTGGKVRARVENPTNNTTIYICGYQLEKNNTMTSYAPYFTPIELNKIGNHQDYIRKGTGASNEPNACTGKNLYEGSQDFSGTWINESSWSTADETYNGLVVKYRKDAWNGIMKEIDVEKNGVYTFSFYGKKSANGTTNVYLGGGVNATPSEASFNLTTEWQRFSVTFSVANSGKIRARVENSNSDSNTYVCGYMLEENNFMTSYEPYVYSTLKDKWYIEKNILKLVVPNAVTGTLQNSNKRFYVNGTNLGSNNILRNTSSSQTYGLYCDILGEITASQTWDGTQGISYDYNSSTDLGCMDFAINGLTTIADYQNALKGKAIYAIANSPEYVLIVNEDLIEQLNALNNGYVYGTNANISVSGNIPSIINISVDAPGRDVEDEITPSNYLTDFKQSREYGPVNRVQITMTDIEDATYIENQESISKDGIQTITINDNYFLSSEELKAKAIRPLWNSLYTMKYMPISCKYLGLPYIEMNDYIGVALPDGNVTGTYVFNYKFTYNGGYMGELETPTISRTQETYPTESINSQVQKMGINVDRANARITSEIIARQETDENVTRIEQSIDEINLSVSTTQTDLSNLEGQVQTNTASIGVNADNISLAVEKNTQTQDQLDTLQTNTQDIVNQLVFNGDGLTISAIGSTSDDMKLNLTNDAINFMYNNNVILKINGSTIEFANASFQKLDLGNYVWVAEDDDSLSLIYEGE